MDIGNLPPLLDKDVIIALGIEGSANKIGVGILKYENGQYTILSNPRKTYISPAGQGFLPRETAWHHQNHIVALIRQVYIYNKNDQQISLYVFILYLISAYRQ